VRGTSDPVGAEESGRRASSRARPVLLVAGIFLLVGAVVLALFRDEVEGGALIAAVMLAEAGTLLALGLRERPFSALPAAARLPAAAPPPRGRLSTGAIVAALVAITGVGVALRLVGLDGDLWLDEIVTVRDYASQSVGVILTRYDAPNNHLLNSLLAHGAIAAFGYEEWAIRLPALITGLATIPAFFWVARPLLGDARSLAAAALLAVSSQHILFSQNARGNTASLLFGLLATGALVRALREDRMRWWLLYVATAVLCVAAVPTGGFIIAAHVLVCVVVAVRLRASGALAQLLGRLTLVFGAIVALTLQLYAPVIGKIGPAAQGAWNEPGAGTSVLSTGFLRGLADDVSAGAGPLVLVLAVPALVAGMLGARVLLRRDWVLLVALSLGPLLHAGIVVVRGLAFSPRFLLFLVFPILLVAVEAVAVVARWLASLRGTSESGRRGLEVAGLALAAVALALPLLRTAGLDKQPYREALVHARSLRPEGLVIGVYHAGAGVVYYGVDHPDGAALVPGDTVGVARTLPDLDALLSSSRDPVLVTSQESLLRDSRPALLARIERDFVRQETFPAAIGGADLTVWLPRS